VRRAATFALAAALPMALAVHSAARGSAPPHGASRTGKSTRLTYARDVATIIRNNCATCHRPGEVAPFSLLDYQDIKKRARQIALVTKSRYMPPWKADSHGEFVDERRLTEEQIATLSAWANAGTPEGDPRELPPPPKLPSTWNGWHLGPPDLVTGMPVSYKLGADGADVYRCFVIPTDGKEDRYISALEVHPGNRRIVHHVIAYLDTSGTARKLAAADPGPGYTSTGGGPGFLPSGFLGGWAPGNEPHRLPDGIGNSLPKGADIVLEVHYHKSGKPETDQTKIGIYYAKGPVSKRIRILPVLNPFFKIPAGAPDQVVNASMPVFKNMTILAITPHMHLLGRSMAVFATLPDKTTRPLIRVPEWDFNWQITYGYKEPVKLPGGSTVSLVAHYDNSPRNPRNPNTSPRDVTWGEQTTDEMCIAFLSYTLDSEDLLEQTARN
jgi:mono/diheme cytochrome c family protein